MTLFRGNFFLGIVAGLGGLALCMVPAGCGGHRANQAQEESNLKPLALLYGQFIGQNRGQPPATEAQFKDFVRSQGKPLLESFQVSDVDGIFVSSRDGKPYVVRYGPAAAKGPPGPGGAAVIAYEQVGVGDRRFVASAMGAVEEVDEARFKQLVPSGP